MSCTVDDLQLLRTLADGRFHSGEQLASRLGVGRTAVWKRVQRLRQVLGLQVDAVRGRGYRLAAPIELLDAGLIETSLSAAGREQLSGLVLLPTTGSTNEVAMAAPPPPVGRARVWLAEHQTAGRGRRGRQWICAFGSSLYLSMTWRFDRPLSALAGLSLIAGLVVAETLESLGVERVALKWPNDVVIDRFKLCGILVEAAGETAGPVTAVIGVGLNVRLPDMAGEAIDQPWTDLERLGAGHIGRNVLAAGLVDALIQACARFAREPLSNFLPRWQRYDALSDRLIRLNVAGAFREGRYRGVAANGAVRIETARGIEEHMAGEVSVRDAGA